MSFLSSFAKFTLGTGLVLSVSVPTFAAQARQPEGLDIVQKIIERITTDLATQLPEKIKSISLESGKGRIRLSTGTQRVKELKTSGTVRTTLEKIELRLLDLKGPTFEKLSPSLNIGGPVTDIIVNYNVQKGPTTALLATTLVTFETNKIAGPFKVGLGADHQQVLNFLINSVTATLSISGNTVTVVGHADLVQSEINILKNERAAIPTRTIKAHFKLVANPDDIVFDFDTAGPIQ